MNRNTSKNMSRDITNLRTGSCILRHIKLYSFSVRDNKMGYPFFNEQNMLNSWSKPILLQVIYGKIIVQAKFYLRWELYGQKQI